MWALAVVPKLVCLLYYFRDYLNLCNLWREFNWVAGRAERHDTGQVNRGVLGNLHQKMVASFTHKTNQSTVKTAIEMGLKLIIAFRVWYWTDHNVFATHTFLFFYIYVPVNSKTYWKPIQGFLKLSLILLLHFFTPKLCA